MFLFFHMIFSIARAAVVWAILERISGFDPSLEMIAQGTWSSPLLLASDLLSWPLFESHLGCLSSLLSYLDRSPFCTLWWFYVSRRSTRTPASSSSSAFTTMSSAKRKLVISRPPMLTLPSWSSNASHMILSRKILKRIGDRRHLCRISTVVLNHSPVMPLNRTALWALSYRFSMARMILALMMYFLIVTQDLQVSVATRFCRVLIFASSRYLSVIYLFHAMIHWWVRKLPRGPNNCMFWAMIEAEGEVGYP